MTPGKHTPVFGIVAENVTDKMSSGRCWTVKSHSMDPNSAKVQIVLMEQLEKGLKRMDLHVYQKQCPYEVLKELLAADKRDKSEESTDMGAADYTATNETSSVLLHEGTYVCIQPKKAKLNFGVLMRDVTLDDKSGTCLIASLAFERYTYQDFSLDVLQKVVDRNQKHTRTGHQTYKRKAGGCLPRTKRNGGGHSGFDGEVLKKISWRDGCASHMHKL